MRDGIVTGEGVVIDARPASFATRMLAIALDLVAVFLLLIALIWAVGFTRVEVSEQILRILMVVLVVSVTVVVPTAVETLSRGRSLGKWAAGIRVIRDDGGPVRFRQAFIRALAGVGELWFTAGSVGLIASLLNDKGKRLGDLLAGTYVVRTRGGASTSVTVAMPPQLASWAHGADMLRLPDGLALAIRQFLARADKLAPGARVRLGQELAGRLEHQVAPGPPPGTHPEMFMMAVLAERRSRDWDSARNAQARARAQEEMVHRLPFAIPDPVD
ncbi:MAG: RDD family protein [Cellulomonadaceae bacterium]